MSFIKGKPKIGADCCNNESSFSLGYTEYLSYIQQSGSVNGPVAMDINDSGGTSPQVDTIGGTWARIGLGQYTYTSVGAFADVNKVSVMVSAISGQSPDVSLQVLVLDDDTLQVDSFRWSAFGPLGLKTYEDDLIYLHLIHIKVYE